MEHIYNKRILVILEIYLRWKNALEADSRLLSHTAALKKNPDFILIKNNSV